MLIACGGGKPVDLNADATAAAATPAVTEVQLTAKNDKFDKSTLVIQAGQQITLTLDNQDGSVLHNVSIYTDKTASDSIYKGDFVKGVKTQDYTFTAPAPGVYYFRCDAHPDTMRGTLVVR